MYGFFIGLAVVTGYSIAEKIEPRVKEGAGYVIIAGLLGARLYHVLDFWSYYSTHLNEIFYVWNGGLSIWGALIAGGIVVAIINRKFSNSRIWGAIATALPLAQAIGRLGNAVNHEFTNLVLGIPWWGAEAILDLVLFVIIWCLPMKYRVVVYLLGYGSIRYLLQPYRA
jgi:phosphatidylglycerol:prolipoprotein diacylglycerol transferase